MYLGKSCNETFIIFFVSLQIVGNNTLPISIKYYFVDDIYYTLEKLAMWYFLLLFTVFKDLIFEQRTWHPTLLPLF